MHTIFQKIQRLSLLSLFLLPTITCIPACGGGDWEPEETAEAMEKAARIKCGVSMEFIGPLPGECYE